MELLVSYLYFLIGFLYLILSKFIKIPFFNNHHTIYLFIAISYFGVGYVYLNHAI